MKILLQRVSQARAILVETDALLGAIDRGFCVLVCTAPEDGPEEANFMARKVALMRLFEDEAGKMNKSLLDVGGAALVVSQFTLAAEWRKGNRPSFSSAADPEHAQTMYRLFCDELEAHGVHVETGQFRSHMRLEIHNDGPATIWMDSNT